MELKALAELRRDELLYMTRLRESNKWNWKVYLLAYSKRLRLAVENPINGIESVWTILCWGLMGADAESNKWNWKKLNVVTFETMVKCIRIQ